jgi:fibronectin type 3 domain-containing protein
MKKRQKIVNKIIAILFVIAGVLLNPSAARAAACGAQSVDYGSVTTTLAIPAASTYKLWTRMMVPDATNNTYLLEIDGNNCFTVGGSGVAAAQWVWVDFQPGGTSTKIQASLSQGSHTLKLIGNKPDVKIDRILAAADLNCIPNGTGDGNCSATADVQNPTATIKDPAEGATVSGNVTINADASDDVGVSKVEFYDNGVLISSDTSAPYSAVWDSTKVPNGTHTITAKAYDAAGHTGSQSRLLNAQNGDTKAPTTPGGVTAAPLTYSSVKVSWTASTDDVGVTTYTILRDGVPIKTTGNVLSYTDTGLFANTQYSYQVLAADAAGNKSAASGKVTVKTLTVPDTQAPTKPSNLVAAAISVSQINLGWSASTDNIGVVAYDVYRSSNGGQPEMVGSSITQSYGDSNLSANTQYTYYVVARDASGNKSEASATAVATTQQPAPAKQYSSIRGVIRDQSNNKGLPRASVKLIVGNNKHIYQANRQGGYAIMHLSVGRYNAVYRSPGYNAQTISLVLTDTPLSKDVNLQKK